MVTDPIADMLTRIRNASLAHLDRIEMPASKLKKSVADILMSEGYVADVRLTDGTGSQKNLVVVMKYGKGRLSAIAGLKRRSRPGRRIYVGHDELPRVHNGMGIAILSTSKGLMSDKEARKTGIGGELLCEVW